MRGDVLVEPGLIRDLGVARGQIEQAALLAAPRHDDSDAAPARARASSRAAPCRRLGTTPARESRGHRALGVELLQRRLGRRLGQIRRAALRRIARLRPERAGHELVRSTTRPRRIWKTCTTAPAGPSFRPNASRSPNSGLAIFCCRVAQRLDRLERVAQLRGLLEPFFGGRLGHALAQRVHQLVVAAFEEQLRVSTAMRYSPPSRSRDARRRAALDVVLEARPRRARPVIVSLHDRNPEQLVAQRHRLAGQRRRHERAGVEVAVALDPPRHQTPRKRLAGGQLQVRIGLVVAQQDVVASATAA